MLLGTTLCRSWSIYGLKQGIPWQFIFGFFLFLLILCLPNVSNKFYHDTGSDKFSEQHKQRAGECCLGESCVISWSRYDLKQGIPWKFNCFVLFMFLLIYVFLCMKITNMFRVGIPPLQHLLSIFVFPLFLLLVHDSRS